MLILKELERLPDHPLQYKHLIRTQIIVVLGPPMSNALVRPPFLTMVRGGRSSLLTRRAIPSERWGVS